MKYSFRASHYTNGANVPKVVYPWHYTTLDSTTWMAKYKRLEYAFMLHVTTTL